MILFFISFIAGVLTVLAPCVLPLLPVIVGGSLTTGSHRRAYAICIALGGSVIVFTLLLKASTAFIMIPQSFWEWLSGGILVLFGIVMLFPQLWDSLGFVNLLNRSSNKALAIGYQKNSLWGDMLMGASLGPVFSSCSPTYFVILATVLPASFAVGIADLLAYAIGLSGFLLIIAIAGQRLVDKLGVTISPTGWFRRGIGILFILVGLGVLTGTEARLEAWLLNHGFDVTALEQRLLGAPQGNGALSQMPNAGNATSSAPMLLTPAEKALIYKKAPEIAGIDGYINTGTNPDGTQKKITIGEWKGKKVVLVDFWTYSCINCQRELPYVKAWYDKYADKGLQIISVHTPEFAFEHVLANVQAAVTGFGVKYPVVLDNEYGTWNAFGNQFWPRVYIIDIDGFIAYDHAGEGDYDKTEAAIQKALAERDARLGATSTMPTISAPAGVVEVDNAKLGSPETYFGSARNEYLGNGTQNVAGTQTLQIPADIQPNALYLDGEWAFEPEYATSKSAHAHIRYRYSAKNVYLVASAATPVKIHVTIDGKAPGVAHGPDIDESGEGTIREDRLYQLIRDVGYATHTIDIEVEGAGLDAYTFTFG